jgi:hypothetical protein
MKMVGIHKKVKKLLGIIQKYSPILSNFVPGLGEVVESLSELGEDVADGVANVYDDYSTARIANKNINLEMEFVHSFEDQNLFLKVLLIL